jgi:hypothetical protein
MAKQDVEQETCASFVLNPEGTFHSYWDPIMICLMMYIAFFLPYKLSFWEKDPQFIVVIDYFIDIFFLMDIFVNFITSYHEPLTNSMVMSPKIIATRYLSAWFIFDFIAVVPVDLILNMFLTAPSKGKSNLGTLKLARLIRLYRLYRLVRLVKMLRVGKLCSNIQNAVEKVVTFEGSTLRLVKLGLIVSFCIHMMTCTWFYMAKFSDLDRDTWVYRYGFRDLPP